MSAVESSESSGSPTPNPSHAALPRLVTTPKRSTLPRPASNAKNRVSAHSNLSHVQSRPPSHAVPIFESSLSYTLVRDFAYPTLHPLHYGPAPEPSEPGSIVSTPISESHRRLSDPARGSLGPSLGGWSAGPWGGDGSVTGEQAPPVFLHDGPPYSEDDDLQSPVVTARHRRHKSTKGDYAGGQGRGRRRGPEEQREGHDDDERVSQYYDDRRGHFAGTTEDGSEMYYVGHPDGVADGLGGDYVTYPPGQGRHPVLAPFNTRSHRDSHFSVTLPNRSYVGQPSKHDDRHDAKAHPNAVSSPADGDDEARYSRNYQFTITSPDEEMHGKAVALFDFARENENELPLVEGQVIWVSYRHGQGWLVAEDPRTGESGLVPEEYVRLLRDIRGGWDSFTGEAKGERSSFESPIMDDNTPTQADQQLTPLAQSPQQHSNGHAHPPIVSTFSTSSKDLDPYPSHLLGTQPGQNPPQVAHYNGRPGGSHMNTPDPASPKEILPARRRSGGSEDKTA